MTSIDKKSLILFLLDNSQSAIKQYKGNIMNLNENEINNLYEGVQDFKYTSINSNERFFQILLKKLGNFNYLFDSWPDKSKRCYIKELWEYNTCLEDLRKLTNEQIKQKCPFIQNWPSNIQDEFFKIAHDYEAITQEILNIDYSDNDSKELIDSTNQLYNIIEKSQNKEYEAFIKKSFKDISKDMAREISYLSMVNAFCLKKARKIALVKNTKIEEILISSSIKNKWVQNKADSIINQVHKKTEVTTETIDWNRFFNNKYTAIAYAVSTLIVFYNTVCTFQKISEELQKIDAYNNRLNLIKKSFINHLDEVQYRLVDISVLKRCKLGIEKDLSDLEELIKQMEYSIQILKNQQKKSIFDTAMSGISTGLGIIGTAAATGGFSLVYGIGAAVNAFSTGLSISDIIRAENGIKELIKLLAKAKNQREIMENELKKLEVRIKDQNSFFKKNAF